MNSNWFGESFVALLGITLVAVVVWLILDSPIEAVIGVAVAVLFLAMTANCGR